MHAQFPWAEVGLAKKMGVARDKIRTIRKGMFQKGRDWTVDGKNVVWSAEAAERLAGSLGCAGALTEKGAVLDSPVSEETRSCVVVRRSMNPHMLVCQNGDGELFVQVKSNLNFKPGMALVAKKTAGGVWALEGRTPRFPGRW